MIQLLFNGGFTLQQPLRSRLPNGLIKRHVLLQGLPVLLVCLKLSQHLHLSSLLREVVVMNSLIHIVWINYEEINSTA